MSYAQNPYQGQLGDFAALAAADERSTFITKTYTHLAGAIALFAALEAVILSSGIAESIMGLMGARWGWAIVLGLFVVVSIVASNWAVSAVSPAKQYAGLGLYVLAESIIFAPLLSIAQRYDVLNHTNVIGSAALTTLILFGGLTAAVFITRKDFSFLGTFLVFGSIAAVGFVVVALIFQLAVPALFIYAMIALACGYILYDTSNVLHHYRIGQHVAAALALFASVALLFYYLVMLFMSRRD
jgi:hypothetical protein